MLRDLQHPILWTFSYNYGYRDYFFSARVVYDWIDDLTVFPDDQTWLGALHERALREADVVCEVARNPHETLLLDRPNGLYFPNAVDADHFSEAPTPNPAKRGRAFRKVLAKGKPIVGYYGALAR